MRRQRCIFRSDRESRGGICVGHVGEGWSTVIFSEVTEVRDAIHPLTARAANADVARDLIREMAWYDDYLARGGVDRSANPSPGNARGGLTNIVEKTLGAVAKAGTAPISGVAGLGERATGEGPGLSPLHRRATSFAARCRRQRG